MQRKKFDTIVTALGLFLAVAFAAIGGLLTWGGTFANNTVHDQLAAQKITIPPMASGALDDPKIKPYLEKYAGQQMTTGAQAEAYADHFIGVHVTYIAGGKTYSEVSGDQMAMAAQLKVDPTNKALLAQNAVLTGQKQTLFMGETLRGMLLNAYAFSIFGQIAIYSSYAAYAAAVILFGLALLGWRHAAKVDPRVRM
ncbi:MAG: hypothetical protein EBS41_01280 [Actinobacteria bacterium]|nr:hypothetical protein [Actinomycetota bacterium]